MPESLVGDDESLTYHDVRHGSYIGRDFFERTPESVVAFDHESLERGRFTVYLEPGESFKVAEDGPTCTRVRTLDPTAYEGERSVD